MTAIKCLSDCKFSQNSERYCNLNYVEMKQLSKFSPKLGCVQYVAAQVVEQNFGQKDMDYAMGAAMKEKLNS